MLIKLRYLLLFYNCIVYSNHNVTFDGRIMNSDDGAKVLLMKYNYGEYVIAQTQIKSRNFSFNLKNTSEGVYSLLIDYSSSTTNIQQVRQFNLIIDKSEGAIKLNYNPTADEYPEIIESAINEKYYQFLKTERFRFSVLKEIEMAIATNNYTFNSSDKLKDILEQEKQELNEIVINYINTNYNRWSTALVKNSTNLLKCNEITKDRYWSNFDTQNPDLINTPIFQKAIQFFLIKYYTNANEDQYKQAFEEIVTQFNKNPQTNKWVVKYLIIGFSQLGNKNLEDYFSKKYNYKI